MSCRGALRRIVARRGLLICVVLRCVVLCRGALCYDTLQYDMIRLNNILHGINLHVMA